METLFSILMFFFYSLRSNTPASSIRLPNKGNTMKKSSSVNDLHSFGVAKLNPLIPYRRTKSIHDIDTSSKSVRNISCFNQFYHLSRRNVTRKVVPNNEKGIHFTTIG